MQLTNISDFKDKPCVFRCAIENARIQSSKLAFLTVAQEAHTVQVVIAEDGKNVSKQMVKFIGDITPESLCLLHGIVKGSPEPINSATVHDFEIQATKVFLVSKSHTPLPLQPADSERALPSENDKEASTSPLVKLDTRLNHRVIDLRAKINHGIFVIKDGVDGLFQEFLRSHGFLRIHTPKIIGAPSEGRRFSCSQCSF